MIVAISIISCTSTRGIEPVYITDDIPFMLLPTECMDGSFESYQLLDGTFPDGSSAVMEAYIIADSQRIDLVFMANTGQTIAEIGYTGSTVMLSSTFIPAGSLKAEYIIADIQFALYDSTAVAEALSACGLDFSEESIGGLYRRTISHDGSIIWEMTVSGDEIVVINHLRDYRYGIIPL